LVDKAHGINATIDLVKNGTVARSKLESHVRKILEVKYDLGLFEDPFIPEDIDPAALTEAHTPLVLEAARKSIVLLENRNETLPLRPGKQTLSNVALIGPFVDTLNNGDYSGQWGSSSSNSNTLRHAMCSYLAAHYPDVHLTSSWGANTWLYNAQYPIPKDLLSSKSVAGGLLATYYADTEFKEPIFQKQEVPNRDWGLYPPSGLPSNNFSVIWEGDIISPIDSDVDGWIGVATSANISTNLYIDDKRVVQSTKSFESTILANIEDFTYSMLNGSQPPPGAIPFTFPKGLLYKVRLESQIWNYDQKVENVQGVNAQVELFWSLVDRKDPIGKVGFLCPERRTPLRNCNRPLKLH